MLNNFSDLIITNLKEKVFENARVSGGETMTIQGTVNKTCVLLAVVLVTLLIGSPMLLGALAER